MENPTLLSRMTEAAAAEGDSSSMDELLCIGGSDDLYMAMRSTQGEFVSLETYRPHAQYISFRRYLVDWMSQICESFHLHDTTIHVSVLFLDKVLRSRDEIPRNEWQLLGAACISLAAKYEEAEEHCPYIPHLISVAQLSGQTSLTFRKTEIRVLNYLNWKLRATPALHVLGYFEAQGILFPTDRWKAHAKPPKVAASIRKFATFFANMALQQYTFQEYDPSLLAAAILLACRVATKVEPKWRPELIQLTGYREEDLEQVFWKIWNMYASQFPKHVTKYVYRSLSPRTVVLSPQQQQQQQQQHQTDASMRL